MLLGELGGICLKGGEDCRAGLRKDRRREWQCAQRTQPCPLEGLLRLLTSPGRLCFSSPCPSVPLDACGQARSLPGMLPLLCRPSEVTCCHTVVSPGLCSLWLDWIDPAPLDFQLLFLCTHLFIYATFGRSAGCRLCARALGISELVSGHRKSVPRTCPQVGPLLEPCCNWPAEGDGVGLRHSGL